MNVRFKESAGHDWHSGTFPEKLPVVLGMIGDVFAVSDCEPGDGWQGYLSTLRVKDSEGDLLAMVAYGGRNPGVHVQVSGDASGSWVGHLRDSAAHLQTTRVDVAIDWTGSDLFESIVATGVELAQTSGIKILSAGDWHSETKSRTIYFGSPSSRVRLRVYEKGRELIEKHGRNLRGVDVPADWVRCEIQLRPTDEFSRRAVHLMEPVELFGASRIARTIIRQIEGLEVPKLRIQSVKVPAAIEARYRAGLRQYGRILADYRARVGHEAFYDQLAFDLDMIEARCKR